MWRSKINLLGQKYLLYSKNEEIEMNEWEIERIRIKA